MIISLLQLGALFHLVNPKQPTGKIIGGSDADIKEFPSYASLVQIEPEGKRLICGGVYIRELWVLTAAHCLLEPNVVMKLLEPDKLLVRMGMSTLNDTYQERQPKRLYKHPHYPQSAKTINDIGLVKIDTKFELSDSVALATMVNTSRFSRQLIVVGFGDVNPNNTKNPTPFFHLQKVEVVARQVYKGFIECSDPTPKGTCFGDSGGPLYVRESLMLAGIVSVGKCDKGYTLYANVHAYKKWINGTIDEAFSIYGGSRNCIVYSLLLSRLIASLMYIM